MPPDKPGMPAEEIEGTIETVDRFFCNACGKVIDDTVPYIYAEIGWTHMKKTAIRFCSLACCENWIKEINQQIRNPLGNTKDEQTSDIQMRPLPEENDG